MSIKEYTHIQDDDDLQAIFEVGNVLLWSYLVDKNMNNVFKTELIDIVLSSRFNAHARQISYEVLSFDIPKNIFIRNCCTYCKYDFIVVDKDNPNWKLTVINNDL